MDCIIIPLTLWFLVTITLINIVTTYLTFFTKANFNQIVISKFFENIIILIFGFSTFIKNN
jgi:hypothetical protein